MKSSEIARAILLSRKIRDLEAELAPLKEKIREAALECREVGCHLGEDRVEFNSSEGVATVTFPKDKVVLVKGADPNTLRAVLPETQWAQLFQVKVSPSPGALDVLDHIKGATRRVVDKVLAVEPSTPAVLLAK